MTMTSELDARARKGASVLWRAVLILGLWLALPLRRATLRARNPLWPVTPSLLWGALAAAALVIATMFLFDAWAITQARMLPAWLVDVFDFFTDFGKSGWFLGPVGSLLIFLALVASFTKSRQIHLMLTSIALRLWFLFLAIALPGMLTDVLKLVGRGRPFATGTADPFVYSFLDMQHDYESLPSGHATTAFAAAIAFGALWPGTRPFVWFYAVAIAVSRVVVTAHHPSDVIAGAVVGIMGALLVRHWFAARRLVFLVDAGGRVRARSGPARRRVGIACRGLSGRPRRGALLVR